MLVNNNDARPKIRSPNRGKNWYPGRITLPANLVFRLEIWGARDNGIPPRSTPASKKDSLYSRVPLIYLAQLSSF